MKAINVNKNDRCRINGRFIPVNWIYGKMPVQLTRRKHDHYDIPMRLKNGQRGYYRRQVDEYEVYRREFYYMCAPDKVGRTLTVYDHYNGGWIELTVNSIAHNPDQYFDHIWATIVSSILKKYSTDELQYLSKGQRVSLEDGKSIPLKTDITQKYESVYRHRPFRNGVTTEYDCHKGTTESYWAGNPRCNYYRDVPYNN